MSKSINLLSKRRGETNQDDHILSIVRRLSLFALVIVVFCTLTLFALNYDTTLPQLKQQQNTNLTNISLLHNKTAKIFFIKDRLAQIQLIMKGRNNYEDVLTQVTQLTPADVSIDEFDIAENVLLVTFSSKSLSSLSDVLDTMTSMVNSKQTLQTLTLSDLSADTAKYTVTIKAKLL